MIKNGKTRIKSHMTMEYNFSGIRLQSGTLTPVDWNVTVDLLAVCKKGSSKEEVEYSASVTYQRIYFWLDTNLPNIILVNVTNEDDLYIANLSSNIMMFCPDVPSDDLLIQLIHAKISALADSNLLVGDIHLKGSDTSLQYTFDYNDSGYALPADTVDYYAEGVAKDLVPWWHRNDGFCFEFIRPKDTEQSDEELFGQIVDPMIEFQSFLDESINAGISVAKEPAKIIQIEKWKPRTI